MVNPAYTRALVKLAEATAHAEKLREALSEATAQCQRAVSAARACHRFDATPPQRVVVTTGAGEDYMIEIKGGGRGVLTYDVTKVERLPQ